MQETQRLPHSPGAPSPAAPYQIASPSEVGSTVSPFPVDSDDAASDLGEDDEHSAPRPITPQFRRRMLLAVAVLIVLGLTAVLPPLINVNRYQRQIANSISASLGRPVHLDSVTLNMLPLPGFTLTNFVVSEDPAFGFEPVIRANTVTATLRMRSLWHRRLEFSKIALEEPSVNLVRRADGRWNIESILLQASRIPVVPTDQKSAAIGGIQRFPYIEATGARVNFKQGLEKRPISLTDAEFALWLPRPETWRLRLEAHPDRTDTAATDSGTLRIEGTLGKASRLENVPIDLRAEWTSVPLGAASWVLMGRDGGMRGELTLRAAVKGTVNQNLATARLQVERLRKADFVPADTLNVDVSCQASTTSLFHQLAGVKCLWPPGAEHSALGSVVVNGAVGDVRRVDSVQLHAETTNISAASILGVLRMESPRISPELELGGMIHGVLACCGQDASTSGSGPTAALAWAHPRLLLNGTPLPVGDAELLGNFDTGRFTSASVPLDLGGPQPVALTVQADHTAITTTLTGPALRSRLLALAQALPQFGEGLAEALPPLPAVAPAATAPEAPIPVDLVGSRPWGGPQVWVQAPHIIPPRKQRRRQPATRRKVPAPTTMQRFRP